MPTGSTARIGLLLGAGVALGLIAVAGADLIVPRPWHVAPTQSAGQPQLATVADSIVFGLTADRPSRTPDIIPLDVKEILCFYEFADLPANAELTCGWQQPGRAGIRVPPDAWRPERTATHATGIFALRASTNAPLLAGVHEVEISDPTGPVDTASFCALREASELLNAAAPTPGETKVLSAVVTDSVTPEGRPGPQRARFPVAGRIYLVFQYRGAERGMAFSVAWIANGDPITQATQDVVIIAPEGWGQAWIETAPTSPLPTGQYQASVSLPGATSPAATVTFEVR